MELKAAGIAEQPFRTHGRPLHFVFYQAQADAARFLHATFEDPRGLGILQGPSLSGKSTLLQHFTESLPDEADAAVVDARRSDPKALLEAILQHFGLPVRLNSINELLNMLRVFAMQQASAHHAPLLVIENTHELSPDTLRLLRTIASWQVRGQYALRIVLASDCPVVSMIEAPAMEGIGRRITSVFNLYPMEDYEVQAYLHAKLRAGGCAEPASVLPEATCHAVYNASGGWPGIVDRLVLLALARANECPVGEQHIERSAVPPLTGPGGLERVDITPSPDGEPRLHLTYHGRTLREIPLDRERIMVGRSEYNDVPIVSRFISRHHAMFIRNGDTTVLMDLNSTNGTFVNSRRISNHVMAHDDVVMIGHHGLKFSDVNARGHRTLSGDSFDETDIMKSLDDLRRRLAQENTQLMETDKPGERDDTAGRSG